MAARGARALLRAVRVSASPVAGTAPSPSAARLSAPFSSKAAPEPDVATKPKDAATQEGSATNTTNTAASSSGKDADAASASAAPAQGLFSAFSRLFAQATKAAAPASASTPTPTPTPSSSSSSTSSSSSSSSSASPSSAGSPPPGAQAGGKEQETSGPFTKMVEIGQLLKNELFDPLERSSAPYQAPATRRRSALENSKPAKVIEENKEQTGLVMHSESKWQQQWSEFKDNNPLAKVLFGLRMKYDESDNIFVRAARSVTDTLADKFGNVFEEGETAQVLGEIAKIDRNFRLDEFTQHIERTVAPAVIEAFMAGDEATLKEWCSDMCFSVLGEQIRQRKQAGLKFESRILELRNCELAAARMMEQGPVLMFSFYTQQVLCVRDALGAIREGGEDHVERVIYVLAMRRDQHNFDPLGAWQVLELAMAGKMETW